MKTLKLLYNYLKPTVVRLDKLIWNQYTVSAFGLILGVFGIIFLINGDPKGKFHLLTALVFMSLSRIMRIENRIEKAVVSGRSLLERIENAENKTV